MSVAAVTPGSDLEVGPMTSTEKKVILASSLGTIFEWYDFYLAILLATEIAKVFYSGVNPSAGFIFALLSFAAGFAVRPFGALIFGHVGDLVGRKYSLLVTMTIMGLATFLVGCIPSYTRWGIAAPIIFIGLRLLQGLALGGEYGGAATYVAEHAPHGRRGYYTSFIQTTATIGLFLALIVTLIGRLSVSSEAFADWGWRVPFWVSVILLAISIWIRLHLQESPAFQAMKREGTLSKAPLFETFGTWKNAKVALIALLGGTAGQAVVWYGGQFYSFLFLTKTLSVPAKEATIMLAIALLIATPFFLVFGRLSDRIGRKPIILAGCLLAALTYFPIFQAITHYANPDLATAAEKSPVVVVAKDADCSFQLNVVDTADFVTACDVAKAALVNKGIPYKNEEGPAGQASVRIGGQTIASYDASPLIAKKYGEPVDAGELDKATQAKAAFDKSIADTLKSDGYPTTADTAKINYSMVTLLLTILVMYVTMVYAPIAAQLVELFPTRIRYSGMSFPYHVGNGWFGGFLPPTVFAIVAATGDIYWGLWYPIVIALITFVIGLIFMPETKDRDIFTYKGE
jgi:MFS family permease